METDGTHDYLICKELLVSFVVTELDCLQAREGVVYVCGGVHVCAEGSVWMCLVRVAIVCVWMCVCPSVLVGSCSSNIKRIGFTQQAYGLLIRIEQCSVQVEDAAAAFGFVLKALSAACCKPPCHTSRLKGPFTFWVCYIGPLYWRESRDLYGRYL